MKKKRVLFISSTGGHLDELMQLKPMFDKYDSEGCENMIKAICRPLRMISTIAIVSINKVVKDSNLNAHKSQVDNILNASITYVSEKVKDDTKFKEVLDIEYNKYK